MRAALAAVLGSSLGALAQQPEASPWQFGALFGDHMVLPAHSKVPITGRGPVGGTVAVRASWGESATATVAANGTWCASLATAAGPGPFEVRVEAGGQQRTWRDVLVGDVWLASGQSNMEMQLGKIGWSQGVRDHARESALAELPALRVFTVRKNAANEPAQDVAGEWRVCSPATAGEFSAVAFFFGRELVRAGKSPLGIVVSCWGGTVAQAWTSPLGLAAFPEFAADLATLATGSSGGDRQAKLQHYWRAVDDAKQGDSRDVTVPELWSRSELERFDGVATYTRTVSLPEAMIGRDCWLELGPLDDMDTVWWDGARIGGSEDDGAWDTPRRYPIAAARTGKPSAELRVRVVDTGGEGGFAGAADALQLVAADGAVRVPLAGTWQRRLGPSKGELPRWPARAGGPNRPAVLWHGMIAPLVPFPFTGAIWYQGESNRAQPEQYARLFPALIADWRRAFARDLPFFFVQIAPFAYEDGRDDRTAELRAAQAAALALPHTGMVVTLDCGDANDIHPRHKQPVGERLAALALARHYREPVPCEGPVFADVEADDDALRLRFLPTVGGLRLVNGGAGFEVAGAEGPFVAAEATVVGDAVRVRSPAVLQPARVRYAWASVPAWSLVNGPGLPAAPFRAALR